MIVGERYKVLHVRARWGSYRPHWWPVIGPQHEDAEFLNFPHEHFHVDFRFLSEPRRKRSNDSFPHNVNATFFLPISWVCPRGFRSPSNPKRPFAVALADPMLDCFPRKLWLQTRSAVYLGDSPAYPSAAFTWMPELEAAYADAKLGPARVCPHRGADLSEIVPTDDGVIRCPLHGLGWCAETGRLARSFGG